jgi:DNA-directed RNA polymerase omega subunit
MNTLPERTAGLTSQDAVTAIGSFASRYDLVLVAARRMRELMRGDAPLVPTRFGPAVTALLEIEAGKVTRDYLYKQQDIAPRRRSKHY